MLTNYCAEHCFSMAMHQSNSGRSRTGRPAENSHWSSPASPLASKCTRENRPHRRRRNSSFPCCSRYRMCIIPAGDQSCSLVVVVSLEIYISEKQPGRLHKFDRQFLANQRNNALLAAMYKDEPVQGECIYMVTQRLWWNLPITCIFLLGFVAQVTAAWGSDVRDGSANPAIAVTSPDAGPAGVPVPRPSYNTGSGF